MKKIIYLLTLLMLTSVGLAQNANNSENSKNGENMKNTAIIIIDVQNDYFEGGAFPQHNADAILAPTKKAIEQAKNAGGTIVFVKHEATEGFFVKGTKGSEIHAELQPYLNDGVTVVKAHADSFLNTHLEEVLQKNEIKNLIITGMMTQNCVTHTAISKQAEKYNVSVVADMTTAPTEMLNLIALGALADRVNVVQNLEQYNSQ